MDEARMAIAQSGANSGAPRREQIRRAVRPDGPTVALLVHRAPAALQIGRALQHLLVPTAGLFRLVMLALPRCDHRGDRVREQIPIDVSVIAADEEQRVLVANVSGVSEHALLFRVQHALAEYVRVDPRVATQVVQVHLVIVADLFLVVPVRVAAENDEVIPDDVRRVERPLPRDEFLP